VTRDHVDHAVHRVGAPDGAAGTANHFDAFNVLEQRLLHLPVDAAEERRVDAAAVDEHQQRLRERAGQPADADGPVVGVDPRHLDAADETQQLGQRGHARAADVVLREHGNRRRRPPHFRRLLGDGGDLEAPELLEAQLPQRN
jgi:hypothetical protein